MDIISNKRYIKIRIKSSIIHSFSHNSPLCFVLMCFLRWPVSVAL